MFNFMNIDEIEFEELCKQILERKLGKTFRIFGRGADGGIDIQANDNEKIIGQAKLYRNTSQTDTVGKIKKEANRINPKKIEQYYLFIGREMSPQNIQKIYEDFQDILKTKENIFTIKEINELLNKDEYSDIVRQHIKLWLCSTNILEQIMNRNIFMDCEILFDNIKEEVGLFVQTDLYSICQNVLDKERLLLILGMPGIGKTTLSKMLLLYYAQNGYLVRYSNNQNLEDLKKSLSFDKDKKEIIFLDDCLGQRYLELQEQRENDIINLIKYIKRCPNKLLILNSRITIFQEAKERQYELGKCINNKNIEIQVIDIENISKLEKARILKHYLLKKQVPKEYVQSILSNQNYMKIIENNSYNPRIIDYITERKNYIDIKPEDYANSIQNVFKKSKYVWKDEYENRISVEDRLFLITLFSLSDYDVEEVQLKLAFYKRLKQENIDTSVALFEKVLERMNQSFVKIVIKDNKKLIMAINPSVNDFLKEELKGNQLEKEKILKSAIFIEQIKRMSDSQEEYEKVTREKIIKNEFLNLSTITNRSIDDLYLAHILYYNMLNKLEQIDITGAVSRLNFGYEIGNEYIANNTILMKLFDSGKLSEEEILKIFFDGEFLSKILEKQNLEAQVQFLDYIYKKGKNKEMRNEEVLVEHLKREFEQEPSRYLMDDLAEEYGLDDIVAFEIEELKCDYEWDERWNKCTEEDFKADLEKRVKKSFIEVCSRNKQEDVDNIYCELPDELYEKMDFPEVGEWSFDDREMNNIVLKYINYVYNTPEEDYTYYKKSIYDGHLLNKKDDEEDIIHRIFKE